MKDKNGNVIKREKAVGTTQGIVITSNDNQYWQIDFPNGKEQYGGATSERMAIFFLLLGMGHTLEDAQDIAFNKTTKRRK